MSPNLYFLILGAIVLAVCALAVRRGRAPGLHREGGETDQESFAFPEWDPITSELSTKIFSRDDADFVASETPQLARQFRRERTALALDWLRDVRLRVNSMIRFQRTAARGSVDLKPADELRLAFELLFFHVTAGTLHVVIWVCGPPHAARLVQYSLERIGHLQKITDGLVPAGRQVVAELMDGTEAKNHTSTR